MPLKFCPKCDKLMSLQKNEQNSFFECKKCGVYEIDSEGNFLKSKEEIKRESEVKEGVVNSGNIFAGYHHKCKKCGNDKAQIIDMGIFYSDEDNLILLKCGKCGYSERIGDKTT